MGVLQFLFITFLTLVSFARGSSDVDERVLPDPLPTEQSLTEHHSTCVSEALTIALSKHFVFNIVNETHVR
jgi:hypothetical protein